MLQRKGVASTSVPVIRQKCPRRKMPATDHHASLVTAGRQAMPLFAIVHRMKQNPVFSNKFNTLLLCLLTLLVIATSLYVRVRLSDVPLERDEGEYAYMGQLLLKGIPPYSHAYTMKLPGVALAYALFMSILGQSATSIRIGFMLVNIACTGLVYLLGRRLFTRETALSAAAFYAVLSLSQSVLGIFAHATHLVVLFSLSGIILLGRGLEKQQTPKIFMGGICFGMAFLMKQHAAILIPFALFFQIWPQRAGNQKVFLRDCFIFLTGAAAPYAVVALWLFKAGVFDRFWFWTVQYASEYATGLSITEGLNEFAHQVTAIIRPNLPIWLLAGAGIIALLCRQRKTLVENLFLIGYLAASFVMVSQGLYFRPHYFVLMLPATAILAGYAAQSAGHLLPGRLGSLLPTLIIVTAIGCFFYFENAYLFRLTPLEVSRKINGTNPFPEALPIAAYLHSQTTNEDRIAILGSEPEILFYANRLSATGHIYMYGLMENHRYSGQMQSQLITEIESTAPAFIVVVHNSASWLLRADSLNKVLDWGNSYIPLRYDEVGIVEIFGYKPTRYLWGAETAGYEPTAESFVSVFRRR
jgi:Dolichyl-phosphate-mannose-protein mannosyltransferase